MGSSEEGMTKCDVEEYYLKAKNISDRCEGILIPAALWHVMSTSPSDYRVFAYRFGKLWQLFSDKECELEFLYKYGSRDEMIVEQQEKNIPEEVVRKRKQLYINHFDHVVMYIVDIVVRIYIYLFFYTIPRVTSTLCYTISMPKLSPRE
jgi:hypothetical protein